MKRALKWTLGIAGAPVLLARGTFAWMASRLPPDLALGAPLPAATLHDPAGKPMAFADAAALDALGVHVVPTQVLVDREGRVAWTSSFGSLSEGVGAFRGPLDAVLAAK